MTSERVAALSREERLYDAILDMLDFTVGWCRPSMTDAEKLDTICKIGEAAIKLDGDALPSGGVGADERAAEPERAPVNVGGELAKGTLPSDSSAASGRENVAMRPLRQCPHGVNVGPLDDYGVPEGERVFSTYCAECSHDQTGRYPWDTEAGAYQWPEGYHPRTLEDDDGE